MNCCGGLWGQDTPWFLCATVYNILCDEIISFDTFFFNCLLSISQCTCDPAEYPGKSQTAWANALIGRIFWDFLREKHWADMVSNKIQKKLSRIRVCI